LSYLVGGVSELGPTVGDDAIGIGSSLVVLEADLQKPTQSVVDAVLVTEPGHVPYTGAHRREHRNAGIAVRLGMPRT
jgi:hypothetical protein